MEFLSHLGVIGCDIGGGKQSSSTADFAVPPMLIGAIRNGYHVASPKLEFAWFLRREIVEGLHQALKKKGDH